MNIINLTYKEQIIIFYLIANFVIAICLLYLILSVIFRIVFKNEKKKRKKDIVELFWEKDKESKSKTIFKRIFFIFLICLTSLYIFNAVRFIIDNIEIIKNVLKIE